MERRSRNAHGLAVQIGETANKFAMREIGLARECINWNDRAAGEARISQRINALSERARTDPILNRDIDFVALREAVRERVERRIGREIGSLHDFAQAQPLIVGRRADKDPAILGLIAVPRRAHRMPVAGAFRCLA